MVLSIGPVELFCDRICRDWILEPTSIGISLDHRLNKSLIDHVHFFFAVFVFEIHIFAANDRRKLCKIIRNRPVQCDIGKRCLCSPTAWCIHAINERFNTFLNFRITQVVHLDKRCQIRIKRRKCLRTSPFILHDSKEIHHLITKDTQVLCRRGCNLAFDATQPFFDKLFQ